MSEKRTLAVQLDSELFDKLDEYVDEINATKKQYVANLIKSDLEQKMQQMMQQTKEIEIKSGDTQKVWDRDEVIEALDEFMISNNRIPRQIEFKNENGLPSYGAANRALEMSPAEYMKERFDELMLSQQRNLDLALNM